MKRHAAVVIALVAALAAAGVAGGEVASLTRAGLPPRTRNDVALLRAKEAGVLADLGAFAKLAPGAGIGPWKRRLEAAETAQMAAEQQLNVDLGKATPGGLKATHTRLTVTGVSLGETSGFSASKDEQTWHATVLGPNGAPVVLRAGEVKFTLAIGAHVIATFSTSAANPSECSFVSTVSATEQRSRSSAPDSCQGGVGGYYVLRGAQVSSPDVSVTASFLGAPGYAPSRSGKINPESVMNNGQPVSA